MSLTVSEEDRVGGKPEPDLINITFSLWLTVAVIATVLGHLAILDLPFDQDAHSSGSAHFMQMGHEFAVHGLRTTGGVPIQNNDPLGKLPDVYVHMPPGLSLLLGALFRVFGESDAVGRLTTLAMTLATALATAWVVRICAGQRAAILAAFAYLTTPVVFIFGKVLACEYLGVVLLVLAAVPLLKTFGVTGSVRRWWLVAGACVMTLAVLSAWQPALAPAGLALALLAVHDRRLRPVTYVYAGAAFLSVAAVLGWYLLQYPGLFVGLSEAMRARSLPMLHSAKMTQAWPNVHEFTDQAGYVQPPVPLAEIIKSQLRRIELFHPFVVIAALFVVASCVRRSPDRAFNKVQIAVAFLTLPYLLWSLVMAQHSAIHEFVALYAAPVASLSFGIALVLGLARIERASHFSGRRLAQALAVLAVPAMMMLPLWHETTRQWDSSRLTAAPQIPFARAIRDNTAADAVVLVPSETKVHVYYSQRHLIRGIENDGVLDRALPMAVQAFPDSTLYLAMPPDETWRFPEALQRFSAQARSRDVILLLLRKPNR